MSKVVASVMGRSREQVLGLARKAAMQGADWLELRLDEWRAQEDLEPVIEQCRLPVLVACRLPEDGGRFRGTLAQRRELLSRALAAGARGIDLEQWETWQPPSGLTGLALRIRSFHSFTGVPKELAQLRDELSSPGTVVKLVVTASDLADAAPVLALLQETDQERQPLVAFAMGRAAWVTRVLAAAFGAPLVYGCVEPGEAVVPEQPLVSQLVGLYRVHELSRATKLFGVLGNPALHSLGPWLHNRAFRHARVDGLYLPLETARPEAVLSMLPRQRLGGVSVTAPHKQRLLEVCAALDQSAADVGAVNTLVAESDGGLTGYNTDLDGCEHALRAAGAGKHPGAPAAVLGAGGASQAAIVVLQRLGYEVTVLARSLDAARPIAERHGVQLASSSAAVLVELQPRVVVNATPVGSADRDPDERLVPDYVPAPGTIVFDMVYRPGETRLLRDARAAGAVVVPGVEMFLAQAAAQVELFTGTAIPPAALRRHLAGSLP
ncbi:MAG: type I 3-dehydroquinate dehydratase [Planctomycetota bacterium]